MIATRKQAAYLVLGQTRELVGVHTSKVCGLSAEGVAGALNHETVILADEFPLEINRGHYLNTCPKRWISD